MLDLSPAHLEMLQRILHERLPGREVRVFGSRVTGQVKPHSDLDLVVMGEPIPGPLQMAELRADLDDSDLPFKVDLLAWPDLPPSLRADIQLHSQSITH